MKEKEKYVANPNPDKEAKKTITFTEFMGDMREEMESSPMFKYSQLDEEGKNDTVDHPSHYQSASGNGIECIDAMKAAFGDYEVAVFCKVNAFKYLYRADAKGGNEDIRKAVWYLNKFLELGGCDQ